MTTIIKTSVRQSLSCSFVALGTVLSPSPTMAHFTTTFWSGCHHHHLIGERNEAESEKQAECTKVTLNQGRKCFTERKYIQSLTKFSAHCLDKQWVRNKITEGCSTKSCTTLCSTCNPSPNLQAINRQPEVFPASARVSNLGFLFYSTAIWQGVVTSILGLPRTPKTGKANTWSVPFTILFKICDTSR